MISVAIYLIGIMAGFGLGVSFRDWQKERLEFRQRVGRLK